MPIPRKELAKERNGRPPILDVIVRKRGTSIAFTLYKISKKRKQYIGTLKMYCINNRRNRWETHFTGAIPVRYRNKGYGVFLYSVAADFANTMGISLSSSNIRSDMADRAWKSSRLKKYYNITLSQGRYFIKPKSNVSVRVHLT